MRSPLTLLFCIALNLSTASAQYSLRPAFADLPFLYAPVEMQYPEDGTNRLFVVELKGRIIVFENSLTVNTSKVFLDISDKIPQGPNELGILGLAFHPNFKKNGFFYVNYTADVEGQLMSFISRFQANRPDHDTVDNSSEQVLLTVSQPSENHHGGHLAFGTDGYLYASFGDSDESGDTANNSQNLSVFLGKILRLDVDREEKGNHYAVPKDNPFADNLKEYKKEIYAYGFRNPWKFSFDHVTEKLWVGDVGQYSYEEIDTITKGGNYGWRMMEGFHRFTDLTADTTKLKLPIWEYFHNVGFAIVGGYVYRSNSLPELGGKYIYGDYASARIWALHCNGDIVTNQLLIDNDNSGIAISSLAEDQGKNIYILSISNGKIYKLTTTLAVENIHQKEDFKLRVDRTLLETLHPYTDIHITLPESEYIVSTVADIAGREIRRDLDRKMEAGTYSYRFNASSLNDGIYFLRLVSSSGILVQKIIVMK